MSALMFSVLARGATPDSLLILSITITLWSFVAGVAARREGHFCRRSGLSIDDLRSVHENGLPLVAWLGIYSGMGFAVLAKGPIGVVMPLAIIGSYLLFFDETDIAPSGTSWLQSGIACFAQNAGGGCFKRCGSVGDCLLLPSSRCLGTSWLQCEPMGNG